MNEIAYRKNGQVVTRDEFLRGSPGFTPGVPPGGQRPTCWPLESDAAGIHPSQRQAAYEESVRLGVPTDFTKDGKAVLRDKAHRREYLRAIGLRDKDACYGDPC